MLTQRIGKSANEFLTTEGVNPEAVFLLEQGPELVQRDHQGPARRQPADAPAGHARPADRASGCVALLKQYQDTRAPRRRHPDQPAGPDRRARSAERRSSRDSEPLRKGLETVQDRLGATTGFSGRIVVLLILLRDRCAGRSAATASCACTSASRASARRWRRASASRPRPGAGSQARQRRQPGGHSCG